MLLIQKNRLDFTLDLPFNMHTKAIHHVFTVKANGIARELVTEADLQDSVNIVLPNSVEFQSLLVSEGNLGPDTELLIGMDVIGHGDFIVQNNSGKTEFSFCFPAFENKLDMLVKANTINERNQKINFKNRK